MSNLWIDDGKKMIGIILRSGEMPLLLLCLLMCFHRDVPADMSSLWWIGGAVFVYLAVRLVPEKHRRLLLYGFVLWGLVESVVAVLQQAGLVESNHRAFDVTGTFGNPGPLGGLLGMAGVLALGMACGRWRRNGKSAVWAMLPAVIILCGLSLSGSRAGWMGVLVGMGALCGSAFHFSRRAYIIGVSFLCLCAVGLYFLKPDSADGRLLIWYNTLAMWTDNFLFGTGTGGWLANYMHFQADFFALHPSSSWGMLADNVTCPYNEFLRIAAEQGLLGLALAGWMLCEWFRYPSAGWEGNCLKGMLAAFLAFAFFSYPLDVYPLTLAFSVMAGMMKSRPLKAFRLLPCVKYGLAGVSMCILLSVSLWSYRIYKDALSDWSLFPFFRYNPEIMDICAQTGKFREHVPQRELELLEETARIIPTVETYCAMGYIHEKKGDYGRAEICYREAADMIPLRVTAKYRLFNLYLAWKDTVSAVRIGKGLLVQPVKVEGTKTLRMKGEVRKKLQILLQKAGKDESGKICIK